MPHADNRQKKARKVCGLKSKPWKVLEETGKLYRTAANFPILIFEYQLFKKRMSQRDKCLYFFSTTYLKDKKTAAYWLRAKSKPFGGIGGYKYNYTAMQQIILPYFPISSITKADISFSSFARSQ